MGPRQVGKTTLAMNISETVTSVYLDLENRLDLEKVRDIHVFHGENSEKLIVLEMNAVHMVRNLDVTGVTIGRYLDLMVDLLLVSR